QQHREPSRQHARTHSAERTHGQVGARPEGKDRDRNDDQPADNVLAHQHAGWFLGRRIVRAHRAPVGCDGSRTTTLCQPFGACQHAYLCAATQRRASATNTRTAPLTGPLCFEPREGLYFWISPTTTRLAGCTSSTLSESLTYL